MELRDVLGEQNNIVDRALTAHNNTIEDKIQNACVGIFKAMEAKLDFAVKIKDEALRYSH